MKDLKTLVNINSKLILFSFILKGIAKSCFKTEKFQRKSYGHLNILCNEN